MKRSFNLIRLAAVPLSLTLISILAGSVINRVMVVELGLPVTLAGLFLAVPLLVAPVRVWLGHRSDAYPIRGLRREPYIIIGAGLAGLGAAPCRSTRWRAADSWPSRRRSRKGPIIWSRSRFPLNPQS